MGKVGWAGRDLVRRDNSAEPPLAYRCLFSPRAPTPLRQRSEERSGKDGPALTRKPAKAYSIPASLHFPPVLPWLIEKEWIPLSDVGVGAPGGGSTLRHPQLLSQGTCGGIWFFHHRHLFCRLRETKSKAGRTGLLKEQPLTGSHSVSCSSLFSLSAGPKERAMSLPAAWEPLTRGRGMSEERLLKTEQWPSLFLTPKPAAMNKAERINWMERSWLQSCAELG